MTRARHAAKKSRREFTGHDGWQMTEDEEAVFRIDENRFSLMVSAIQCFEAFLYLLSGFDWDMNQTA